MSGLIDPKTGVSCEIEGATFVVRGLSGREKMRCFSLSEKVEENAGRMAIGMDLMEQCITWGLLGIQGVSDFKYGDPTNLDRMSEAQFLAVAKKIWDLSGFDLDSLGNSESSAP